MRPRWCFAIVALLLLSAAPAAACSPVPRPDIVRCYNEAGTLQAHQLFRYGSDNPRPLAELCPTPPPELQDLFARYSAEPRGGIFTIEPYTPEREAELEAGRTRYLQCAYPEFERAGDWHAFVESERDYCSETLRLGVGSCPGPLAISPVRFLVFLVANPSLSTLPYLLPYLLVVVALGAFVRYLWRRDELRAFFRPTRGVQIALILSLLTLPLWLLALGMRWSPLDVLVLGLLFDYPLICLVRYLWRGRWSLAG